MLQRLSSRLRLWLQLVLLLLVVMRGSTPLAQSLISSLLVKLQQVMLMVQLGVVALARSCHQRCELASSKGA
jgi:hypothetical protein